MKKIVLLLVLCLGSFIGRSQSEVVDHVTNTTSCDMDVTFLAMNPATCAIVSSSATYTIPAGTAYPGMSIAIWWWPPLVPGTYLLVAQVSYSKCPGGPSVIVGAGGPCCNPLGFLAPGCNCGPATAHFPSGVFPYPNVGVHFPDLDIF